MTATSSGVPEVADGTSATYGFALSGLRRPAAENKRIERGSGLGRWVARAAAWCRCPSLVLEKQQRGSLDLSTGARLARGLRTRTDKAHGSRSLWAAPATAGRSGDCGR